jgi:cold shock CspA family protein
MMMGFDKINVIGNGGFGFIMMMTLTDKDEFLHINKNAARPNLNEGDIVAIKLAFNEDGQ